MGLYPSILYSAGPQAFYEKFEERTDKKIPSTDSPLSCRHMRVYLWIEWKTTFLTRKLLSHGCG